MLVLVLVREGRRIALASGINIVGRNREADARIADPSLSRRHARIVVEGDTASVERTWHTWRRFRACEARSVYERPAA